jgi:hypothetical protein
MKNHSFLVRPLPASFAADVRSRMRDASGNALTVRHDDAPHQCRSCLQLTAPGEGYIALSYSPFDRPQPFAETGPIYIHERVCTPFHGNGVYPVEFPRSQVVLRAYNERDEIEGAAFVGDRSVEDVIASMLENDRIAYMHARNSTYGCFMFRVERSEAVEAVEG